MKCVFCAEEIQPDALLCRFCGATKAGDEWRPPAGRPGAGSGRPAQGAFTLRTAGVLFLISSAAEVASVTSEVPLLGAFRGGAVAAAYHSVYVLLFLALGVGLVLLRRWAHPLVLAGTLAYTIDKVLYVADRATMKAQVARMLEGYADLLEVADEESVLQLLTLATVLFVACWWGFALYVHARRNALRS